MDPNIALEDLRSLFDFNPAADWEALRADWEEARRAFIALDKAITRRNELPEMWQRI